MALFNTLKEILELLKRSRIEVAVLKGPALIETIYKDWALRWTGDIDLLIPIPDKLELKITKVKLKMKLIR
ncbi:nucleotidyltransferase family protein [candidate division KSB1 bacterium]|nr:nucleotidyltransferase family protein [candidate division KSB1 bacterium]